MLWYAIVCNTIHVFRGLINLLSINRVCKEFTAFLKKYYVMFNDDHRIRISISYVQIYFLFYIQIFHKIFTFHDTTYLIYDRVTHSQFSDTPVEWFVMVELLPRSIGMLHRTPLSISHLDLQLYINSTINKITQSLNCQLSGLPSYYCVQ